MQQSPHISDATFIRIARRIINIAQISQKEVVSILSQPLTSQILEKNTRERIKFLIGIYISEDSLRRFAEYPHVTDPKGSFRYWLNTSSLDYGGLSPLQALISDPERWLPFIYNNMYIIEQPPEATCGMYRSLSDGHVLIVR